VTESTAIPIEDVQKVTEAIKTNVGTVLVGNEENVELLTVSLLTRGHLLIEGVPGIAKTTLANLFARVTGLAYKRVQMTPDTLPADVTGTYVYNDQTGEFSLQRGPLFANLVLADEINRATPKTQSALLEAMEEEQVTISGDTFALPDPFMVVATQNPIEMEGVFDLPEAQRDRFQFKINLELPDFDAESELLSRFDADPQLGPQSVSQAVSLEDLTQARETIQHIYAADAVHEYILKLVRATRNHGDVLHGASPRASIALLNGSKARAAIHGREYITPDDVKALAEPTLIHRLVLTTEADIGGIAPTDIVSDILGSVTVPDTDADEVTHFEKP